MKKKINKKESFKRISIITVIIITVIALISSINNSKTNNVMLDFNISCIDKYNKDGFVVASYNIENIVVSIDNNGDDATIAMKLKTNILSFEELDGCYIGYYVIDDYGNEVYENKIWFPCTDDETINDVKIQLNNLKRVNDTGYSLIKIREFTVEQDEEVDPTGY